MGYENNEKKSDSVFSIRIKAGKRRTYFFDVKSTKASDYFLTITESRRRFNEDGYDRHKIFLYKEDFNKFIKGLSDAVDYVKTDLMPDFDFDAFNHEYPENGEGEFINTEVFPQNASDEIPVSETKVIPISEEIAKEEPEVEEAVVYKNSFSEEEVDKW